MQFLCRQERCLRKQDNFSTLPEHGQKDGFFVASGIARVIWSFLLSISILMSKLVRTDIGGKDFDWNFSQVYLFSKNYAGL